MARNACVACRSGAARALFLLGKPQEERKSGTWGPALVRSLVFLNSLPNGEQPTTARYTTTVLLTIADSCFYSVSPSHRGRYS